MTREIALYEIPETLEEAAVLDDSLLGAYNDSFAGWNECAQTTLGKMQGVNGEIAGSSPLMFVHIHNSGILPKETRLSTRQDLQKAIDVYAKANNGENFTEGLYSDIGIALRTAGDSHAPNDALAKKLAKQLKQRGIKLGAGVLIPISVLTDKDDASAHYGLTLDLNDSATKDTIRDLRDFEWNYQRAEGLACAYRNDRNWISYCENLDRSYANGRVVVVRAVGTPAKILEQRLDDYIKKLAELKTRYNQGLIQLRENLDVELCKAQ